MTEVTSLRPLQEEVARVAEQVWFRHELARRRGTVVISVAQGEGDELKFVVERGAEKLRDAFAHPRPIRADVIIRFSAMTAERPPLSKVG